MQSSLPIPAGFKSGFITIVGRPNVGKSTLMNNMLGQKVAAVSASAQMTRRKQLGILTTENAQIIFMDTPGIHKPHHKLGEYMNDLALDTLTDADVIVWLVDASVTPTGEDVLCAERISEVQNTTPVILALNKVDLLTGEEMLQKQAAYQEFLPDAWACYLSAQKGTGKDGLLEKIIALLPEGPPYYDEEQITDLYERDIAADLIREGAFSYLHDEVPHSIAVRIDEYKERGENGAYISATIFVERDSQKGIVIGRQAGMLKQIGLSARKQIEEMSGRKVFLDLRVKVSKNWRNDPAMLKWMGYLKDE